MVKTALLCTPPATQCHCATAWHAPTTWWHAASDSSASVRWRRTATAPNRPGAVGRPPSPPAPAGLSPWLARSLSSCCHKRRKESRERERERAERERAREKESESKILKKRQCNKRLPVTGTQVFWGRERRERRARRERRGGEEGKGEEREERGRERRPHPVLFAIAVEARPVTATPQARTHFGLENLQKALLLVANHVGQIEALVMNGEARTHTRENESKHERAKD